ncbi:hypothetical protein HanIR_Chr10g0484751 [Helianthus annuus]|nr:hypothetical protein HanIR_Chr10g0484751 [Helianthus annuus]
MNPIQKIVRCNTAFKIRNIKTEAEGPEWVCHRRWVLWNAKRATEWITFKTFTVIKGFGFSLFGILVWIAAINSRLQASGQKLLT